MLVACDDEGRILYYAGPVQFMTTEFGERASYLIGAKRCSLCGNTYLAIQSSLPVKL
jgi:hypothetical protein